MNSKLLKLITILTVFTFSTLANDCDFSRPEIKLESSIKSNMKIISQADSILDFIGSEYITDESAFRKHDKRKVKNNNSPDFLDAVGRLVITDSKGISSACTGYLVSATPGASGKYLGSAAHCINQNANKRDSTGKLFPFKKMDLKSITWTTTIKGKEISRNVSIISFDQESDTLLLKIDSAISFSMIKPLLIDIEEIFDSNLFINYDIPKKLIIAGYSADRYLGQEGKVLTYDDTITNDMAKSLDYGYHQKDLIVETVTFGGASGAPLMAEISEDDLRDDGLLNPHNQMYVIGILHGFSQTDMSSQVLNFRESSTNAHGTNRGYYRDYRELSKLMRDDLKNSFPPL
jgi:hypothetical protein